MRSFVISFLLVVLFAPTARADDDAAFFRFNIAPILTQHCYPCHSADVKKQKAGLRLDTRAGLRKGGESGRVVVPGEPDKSRLIQAVRYGGELKMPPKGKLPDAAIADLERWVKAGAIDPRADAAGPDPADWWSFKPVNRPPIPDVSDRTSSVRNLIDEFVQAKRLAAGLSPSPEADPQTLVRRLYFDLVGLPPTPEDVERFLEESRAQPQAAYERLVDQLLASPRYGERWARHWLDVVHYGETHGYDKDKPRPNAWPYRDYVICAFNEDKPYARFVQEQLAGDVLFPGMRDGVEALGFIAAGPWDFIGHAELPESKIDGRIARHLDRDDMVGNATASFLSLTAQCAQCHDHKFDPITQADYYSLQAVFAALDRADKAYDPVPAIGKRRAELETRRQELRKQQTDLDALVARLAGRELADLDAKIAEVETTGKPPRPEFGYHSEIAADQSTVKWVQVDLGHTAAIDRVVLVGCHDTFNNIGAGFGFPVRYKVELSDDPTFAAGAVTIADFMDRDAANPGVEPQTFPVAGRTARYVRVTATKLAPRKGDYIFGLAELDVTDAGGKNLALGAVVAALDSIEAPPRWRKKNLVDGHFPAGKAATAATLAQLRAERQRLLDRAADADTKGTLVGLVSELALIDTELSRLGKPNLVYAGTVHRGTGNFAGTGATGGKPRPIHVLKRGDVTQTLTEVGPGAIVAIPGLPAARFSLPDGHAEGERRAALARWITDPANPLVWRSIVNRVWLYHFGRGIVDTPGDFGRMGQLPTHPELLDWLAADFRDTGGSLKRLHRLIVTSATYRQSSEADDRRSAIDADNRYLWRMNRRKLEAEAVRDAILAVSGRLDGALGGPSFRDFVIDKPEHSPHYLYGRHDPEDPQSHRRSVYRMIVRSQPQPFLAALDCADPSMRVDRRNETVTPQQALALLNNRLTVAMARHFAARVEGEAPDAQGRITAAWRLALGRSPDAGELRSLAAYAKEHGLANACRVILNLNEFMFVD